MEEQLPEPCYRCYFCHIISALHILAHMLEGDRGVSKLVSISKIKLKKKNQYLHFFYMLLSLLPKWGICAGGGNAGF